MTSIEINLALQIVKENFGDPAKQIVTLLINRKGCSIGMIADELKLNKKIIAQILAILINHHLVECYLNKRKFVDYKFIVRNALNRIKLARTIHTARHTLGNDNNCELILKEILLHGNLEMSSVLLKVLAGQYNQRVLKQKLTDLNAIFLHFNAIKESFVKLVKENFLERLPQIDVDDDDDENKKLKLPKFLPPDINRYVVPEIEIDELRMKKSIDEDFETVASKIKRENENFGDNGIYWKINDKKMIQVFRDEALIEALTNRIDANAGKILKGIFQLADAKIIYDKAIQNTYQSKPITAIDLQKLMINQYSLDYALVEKYLTVILQDSFKIIEKIGDFSGGAYCIDFKHALTNICLANIESYVRERFGSKSLRIFRVILEKNRLEQKEIENFSMIPSKECKALLYDMLNGGLLSLTELSKTSDHAPSKTFYLFHVDIYQTCKKLLENAYKSMLNLMLKREHITQENKRLLEKNEKINVRIGILTAQGAEQAEIDEERAIMSVEELGKLNSFTEHCKKIELAELQLEEAIFIFETYFYYHTVAPVIQTGKK